VPGLTAGNTVGGVLGFLLNTPSAAPGGGG
jgi:hypothetical protein